MIQTPDISKMRPAPFRMEPVHIQLHEQRDHEQQPPAPTRAVCMEMRQQQQQLHTDTSSTLNSSHRRYN